MTPPALNTTILNSSFKRFKSPIRQVEKCNDTILVLFDQKKINRIKENQINESIFLNTKFSKILIFV